MDDFINSGLVLNSSKVFDPSTFQQLDTIVKDASS